MGWYLSLMSLWRMDSYQPVSHNRAEVLDQLRTIQISIVSFSYHPYGIVTSSNPMMTRRTFKVSMSHVFPFDRNV